MDLHHSSHLHRSQNLLEAKEKMVRSILRQYPVLPHSRRLNDQVFLLFLLSHQYRHYLNHKSSWDKSEILDIKTEDRFGVTLSTKISDKILFNGKIGVPIGGIEETLIIGDVEIEFLLNEDGTLKAKVFNRENEFRYIGDELGYTQGLGMSYQVDFESFREIISKLTSQD